MIGFRSLPFRSALPAILSASGLLITLLSPSVAQAGNYSFGLTNDGYVYQIDLTNKSEIMVFNTGFHGAATNAGPNGLAWDEVSRSLYYRKGSNASDGLYRIDFSGATPTQTLLTTSGALTSGSNGAFYKGSYWYISEGSANLMQVSNLTGGGGATVTAHGNFDGTAYSGNYNFGDITITSDGLLFGQTSNAGFFKANIAGIADGTATIATDYLMNPINGTRQLTFGQDGTLYSHETGTGKFYTVDYTSTGANFGKETLYTSGIVNPSNPSQMTKFNDLADSTATPAAIPEAGTVALFGLAIPFVGTVIARRRRKN